jgi:hypothetical protein
MNDIIEKEAQEVKNLLSYKEFSGYKISSDSDLKTLLKKAKVIKEPKKIDNMMPKSKKSSESFQESKKKSFSIFKRKNTLPPLDFEKAIQEIEKCCLRQDFKLEHLRKLLSKQRLSLKDLVYYRNNSQKSTQKQLHSIGKLIKNHYGETTPLRAIDMSSKSSKDKESYSYLN